MSKRILLGIDTNISPATHYALRSLSEFLAQATSEFRLVLLNVISIPYVASPSLGMYVGQHLPMAITPEQRSQAEDVLHRARTELQKRGIAPEQIDLLIRIGLPADEIVKAAKELQVSFIVIGSRGNTLMQRLRRLITGSTSRRVLHFAPCPVMIAVPPPIASTTPRLLPLPDDYAQRYQGEPQAPHASNLVSWYEKAITSYLQEHTDTLTVFTPREVAQKFVPPHKKTPGRKEIAAATLALEQLAGSGLLCRHDVKGELLYVND